VINKTSHFHSLLCNIRADSGFLGVIILQTFVDDNINKGRKAVQSHGRVIACKSIFTNLTVSFFNLTKPVLFMKSLYNSLIGLKHSVTAICHSVSFKPIIVLSIAFIVCLSACKKDKKDAGLGSNYPKELNAIITPDMLSSLKAKGAVVYDGLTPPTINGIFLFEPSLCIYDNSGANLKGAIFDSYEMKFSNQNTGANTIGYEYLDVEAGVDAGADANATFISGSGNNFTVFAQAKGVASGIDVTKLEVISGTKSGTSLTNVQYSTYLVSKGSDPTPLLAPVGTTRIFKDEDLSSDPLTDFRVSTPSILFKKAPVQRSVLSR